MKSVVLIYRKGRDNVCPACSQSQWHVGNCTAECARCGMAAVLDHGRPTIAKQAPRIWTRKVPA